MIQLIPIIENCNEFNVITRIEIDNKIYFPFVEMIFNSSKSVIKESIKHQNIYQIKSRKEKEEYSEFLINLLIKNKFEQFSNFINPKLVVKSCEILIVSKEYNCGNVISSLEFNENSFAKESLLILQLEQNTKRFFNQDRKICKFR